MNVRLRKQLSFSTGLVYQDQFFINHYHMAMDLITVTDDIQQQNVAYDRAKVWIADVLDGSIMIDESNAKLSAWQDLGARVLVLQQDPVDQLVGIMLFHKLNAVMEDRMRVTALEISSSHGDDIFYLHEEGDDSGPAFAEPGWWDQSSPVWSHAPKKKGGKVVDLARQPEWNDYGLDWQPNGSQQDPSVVFAEFGRDADK